MKCCNNFLGEFPHNEDIKTGIDAAKSGTYKLLLWFSSDVKRKKEIELLSGEEIVIKRPFLESALYKLQIIDPDGDKVSLNDCENFSFRTYIERTEDCYTYCENYV